jgi:hypothetical protein
LIGNEQAAALGFPKTAWKLLVPAIRPATWLVETARMFSTRVQALAKVAGPKAFQHLLSERGLKGRTGEFAIPRRIAVRPGEPASATSHADPGAVEPNAAAPEAATAAEPEPASQRVTDGGKQ